MKTQQIQQLLSSSDSELRKLGQRYCHHYRLDYWVYVLPGGVRLGNVSLPNKIFYFPVKYSLVKIDQDLVQSCFINGIQVKSGERFRSLSRIYKIKLCKRN